MRERDLDRGDDLANVALSVFGGMEQEAKHGGRNLCPTHAACLENRRFVRRAQLRKRGIDGSVERGKECPCRVLRHVRLALLCECLQLSLGECLAPRIGEESVEAARRVPDVKTDRSSPGWPGPEIAGRQRRDVLVHFLAALEQSV